MENILVKFEKYSSQWCLRIKKVGNKFYGTLFFNYYECGHIVGNNLEECVNKAEEIIELILNTIPQEILNINQPFVVIKNDGDYCCPIFHTLVRACQRLSVKIYDMVNNKTIDYPDLIKYAEEY